MFNIIPQPVKIDINCEKKGYTVSSNSKISQHHTAYEFITFVKNALKKDILISDDGTENIILKTDSSFPYDEGYTIVCSDDTITATAKNDIGIFYAVQTLKQIFLQSDGVIPSFEIEDYPRFGYRGYLLDCGRYFFSVDEIREITLSEEKYRNIITKLKTKFRGFLQEFNLHKFDYEDMDINEIVSIDSTIDVNELKSKVFNI